jgi:hypothetical protein
MSTGSRVVPCGRTDGQIGRSLIVALRNFANKIKKKHIRTFGYKSYVFEHTDCKASITGRMLGYKLETITK